MNESTALPNEFTQWLARLADQTISADEFEQLNAELERNPVALDYYLHFITTYAGLMDLGHFSPVPNLNIDLSQSHESPRLASGHPIPTRAIPLSPGMTEEERRRHIEEYANQELQNFLKQKETIETPTTPATSWTLSELIQAMAEGFSRLLGVTAKTIKVGFSMGVTLTVLFALTYIVYYRLPVATLTDSLQAQWQAAPEAPQLRRGWHQLNEGYAEITFKQGARMIVQAPCRFRLSSKNRMQLESGSVTTWVPPSAIGFTILTPDTLVKDFGTEFGVCVDAASSSKIHVFKGEVGVSSAHRSHTVAQQRVKQGQTAMKDGQGQIVVEALNQDVQHFVRKLSRSRLLGVPGKRMNLADIVGGGNGFGTGMIGGSFHNAQGSINPITGRVHDMARPGDPPQEKENPYDYQHHIRPCQYITVPELAYVDGVFVPNGQNHQKVVVSSQGHCLTTCPETDGQFKWNIINGWRYRDLDDPGRNTPRLAQANGISLAANLGITFDLKAMTNAMPGVRPTRFTSSVGIPLTYAPEVSEIDLWVLVDGQVRFLQENVGFPSRFEVSIDLNPGEQFLTLMVTDSQTTGKAEFYSNMDWCFWEEPTLILSSLERQ